MCKSTILGKPDSGFPNKIGLNKRPAAIRPLGITGKVPVRPERMDAIRNIKTMAGSPDATTIRVRDGELLVSDGPFAETKEVIVGYDLLECADLDEAIEVARAHPMARSGRLELRPFADLEDQPG